MTDTELVDAALDLWEDGVEVGLEIPAEELCRDRPHLVARVAVRVERLRRAGWLERSARCAAPAARPAARAGDTIDSRFRLSQLLAEGGHGEVWRGTDLVTRREVAVKLPRPGPPAARPPLEVEARHAALVRHRNIVPVYFAGRDGDVQYLVLRLIEGESLAARLARARPSVSAAGRIAREIAAALAHVHARRLVHRDLKPDNVLLDNSGRVYLTDFGIALAAADAGRGQADGTGSLPYMAPEQLRPGVPLDVRCDVYALGVILFEMLTGHLPFEDGVRAKLTGRSPRVAALNPLVPAALAAAVDTCLAPAPADRFASAADLLVALGGDPSTADLMPVDEFRAASWEVRLRYLDVLSTAGAVPHEYLEAVVELLRAPVPSDRRRVEGVLLRAGPSAVSALLAALKRAPADLDYRGALLGLLVRIGPASPAVRAALAEMGLERAVARRGRADRTSAARPRCRAVLLVGVAAVVALAIWLAILGAQLEMARRFPEPVRPARAVCGLVAGCLAVGFVAVRRPRVWVALLVTALVVIAGGLLTAVEVAFYSASDVLNHTLHLPRK